MDDDNILRMDSAVEEVDADTSHHEEGASVEVAADTPVDAVAGDLDGKLVHCNAVVASCLVPVVLDVELGDSDRACLFVFELGERACLLVLQWEHFRDSSRPKLATVHLEVLEVLVEVVLSFSSLHCHSRPPLSCLLQFR